MYVLVNDETVRNCKKERNVFHTDRDQDVKPMQPHLQVKYLEFKMLFLSMKRYHETEEKSLEILK